MRIIRELPTHQPARTLDDILDPIASELTGATSIPAHTHDQDAAIGHIGELSKNARSTWFGLLGLLTFVGVTLMGHQDADFFAVGAGTQLPLVGIKVPVTYFFAAAPTLVAALYIYFHMYLIALWDALGELEQNKGASPITDRVFPWLLSHAALWYRNHVRNDNCAVARPLGWAVVIVSLIFGWLFGVAVLAGFWLRSMPTHEEWLTLWIGLCFWAATMTGLVGIMAARARMENQPREEVAKGYRSRRKLGGVLAVLLAVLSWETTVGSGVITLTKTGQPAILYRADLVGSELTRRPAGWLAAMAPLDGGLRREIPPAGGHRGRPRIDK
jgi:hypothetical protein